MRYLNKGETYATTLVVTDDYTWGESLQVMSWGDWYEAVEQAYNEEHNTTRCGYCSHLTPYSEEDCICENCGNDALN